MNWKLWEREKPKKPKKYAQDFEDLAKAGIDHIAARDGLRSLPEKDYATELGELCQQLVASGESYEDKYLKIRKTNYGGWDVSEQHLWTTNPYDDSGLHHITLIRLLVFPAGRVRIGAREKLVSPDDPQISKMDVRETNSEEVRMGNFNDDDKFNLFFNVRRIEKVIEVIRGTIVSSS